MGISEDAFIEINSRVKKLYTIINPESDRIPDGVEAMNTVFSANKPMIRLADNTTDIGKNIQKGYMQMFVGAISALRNPKAHENIRLDREECKKRLVFASMLMDKLDEDRELYLKDGTEKIWEGRRRSEPEDR